MQCSRGGHVYIYIYIYIGSACERFPLHATSSEYTFTTYLSHLFLGKTDLLQFQILTFLLTLLPHFVFPLGRPHPLSRLRSRYHTYLLHQCPTERRLLSLWDLNAIETAMDLPSTRFASNLWILLDNFDVARQLLSIPTCSSQELFSRFASKIREWPQRTRLPHTLPDEVWVHWIPGHSGILGNTLTDRAAKEAMAMCEYYYPDSWGWQRH